MFSFWNRKTNKSPAVGRTPISLPQTSQTLDAPRPAAKASPRPSFSPQEEAPPPSQSLPEPVADVIPTPHDAAISEVQAKLLQIEQLPPATHSSRSSSRDPLTDAQKHPPEPLFDPATGVQRGFFETLPANASGDSEQLRDEAWSHLSRIRELQSEIAAMHMHMEGIGDGGGSMDVEVDVDIDVDTVPTQEEEEAAKREKEFAKLPGRFKGRRDNIDAMMSKLDDLSQAVTSFHALQPPPLSFDSGPTMHQSTHPNIPTPPGDHAIPVTMRTRQGPPPTALFGLGVGPDEDQIAEVLQDSPLSPPVPLPPDAPTNS